MMTVGEFRSQFPEEGACARYLAGQRWPEGFACPRCGGGSRGYIASRGVYECAACAYQCSVTAGTIFHKTRVPLLGWFWALYRMSQGKKGVSALQLSKEIGVSYPTAWLMQHKIRKAMADRDQKYQLRGLLEVDEGYVGGVERGKKQQTGRGVRKAVVAVAVERRGAGEKGRKPIPGFTALSVVPDASAASLHGFLQAKAEAGSVILTDAWRSYRGIEAKGFQHQPVRRGSDPAEAFRLFPWVHIAISNLKRFLLGTHHKFEPPHLHRYVAEFAYRLNRRGLEHDLFHRLARACLSSNTIIYKDLIASPDLT